MLSGIAPPEIRRSVVLLTSAQPRDLYVLSGIAPPEIRRSVVLLTSAQPRDLYVLSGIAPPEIRRSVHSPNERTKQLTDQRHSLHHHQPVKSRLHSRNSFVSTSQPLLCKPAEARVAKWLEQLEATESNLKLYDVHPKEQLPSGHTLPWRTWRTANRVRSGQAATPAAKHLWGYRESETCVCGAATCDLGHIMTNCRHFGGETKQIRNCRNGGSSCTMDERRCRHDMNEAFHFYPTVS